MVERCNYCQRFHETGTMSYMGTEWKMCPEVPENMLIPLYKVPVTLYGPGNIEIELTKYELAGPLVVNLSVR